MNKLDQFICAWGGPFCAATLGPGLLMAGFVPPPSPELSASEIAGVYQSNAGLIRMGMVLGLLGIAGWAAMVAVISAQMHRMRCPSKLPVFMQLGAGSIGVLTVMFPVMIFAITAFRPDRDPALTQLLNDIGWLIIIPAFPTFIAQFGAISLGVFQDASKTPVFPRWVGYFNIWIAILFMPGAFSYFFMSGPFAWNGLLAFWVAAGAFFVWLMVMPFVLVKAIKNDPGIA